MFRANPFFDVIIYIGKSSKSGAFETNELLICGITVNGFFIIYGYLLSFLEVVLKAIRKLCF